MLRDTQLGTGWGGSGCAPLAGGLSLMGWCCLPLRGLGPVMWHLAEDQPPGASVLAQGGNLVGPGFVLNFHWVFKARLAVWISRGPEGP